MKTEEFVRNQGERIKRNVQDLLNHPFMQSPSRNLLEPFVRAVYGHVVEPLSPWNLDKDMVKLVYVKEKGTDSGMPIMIYAWKNPNLGLIRDIYQNAVLGLAAILSDIYWDTPDMERMVETLKELVTELGLLAIMFVGGTDIAYYPCPGIINRTSFGRLPDGRTEILYKKREDLGRYVKAKYSDPDIYELINVEEDD